MRDERKKISLERFEQDPARVIAYVRRTQAPVEVYNDEGPVATLTPYREEPVAQRTVRAPRNVRANSAPSLSLSDGAADRGGVWRLDDETKRELAKPRWRRSLSRLSPSSLFRLSSALPLLAWFKS
ncbi:MAG: hypothetical protein HQK87_11555 [Nitrospinae bacterium]|nr:hypothetical protein [Nitrospinota bacterium]